MVKLSNRLEILAHSLQTMALMVFIPIDISLLQHSASTIGAQVVALAATIFSFISLACVYYWQFKKDSLMNYCQMAQETQHATEEPVISA